MHTVKALLVTAAAVLFFLPQSACLPTSAGQADATTGADTNTARDTNTNPTDTRTTSDADVTTDVAPADGTPRITPDPVHFGQVDAGTTSTLIVTLTNIGSSSLEIRDILIDGSADFAAAAGEGSVDVQGIQHVNTPSVPITAGGTYAFNLVYSPADDSEDIACLLVQYAGPNGGEREYSVEIRGNDGTIGLCDRDGFGGPFLERIEDFRNSDDIVTSTIYAANDSESEPISRLQLEFYQGSQTGPGTYEITGQNYKDCLFCVRVLADCTEATGCEKTFLAVAGTVEIEAWDGEVFSGTASGLAFEEVTIDDSFTSTPVPGGESWCISNYTFSATYEEPPAVTCAPDQPVFAPDTIGAEVSGTAASNDRTVILTASTGTEVRDVLSLELFEALGASLGPGTYEYTYEAYEDCSTCVSLSLGCRQVDNDVVCDGGEYLATAGTIEITSSGDAGDVFQGTLTDFRFAEHDFAEDFSSTLVENGRSFCLDSMGFDVVLQERNP